MGLSGEAVRRYVDEWIVGISDVARLAESIGSDIRERNVPSYADRSHLTQADPIRACVSLNLLCDGPP